MIFGAVLAGSGLLSVLLFTFVAQELAPGEDRGAFFITVEGPEGAGYDYTVAQMKKVETLLTPLTGPDKPIQRVNTRVPGFFGASEDMNSGQAIIFLQDWDKRDETTAEVVASLRSELAAIPSVRATPFVRTGLIRSNSRPLQIVLGGPDYQEIARLARPDARAHGGQSGHPRRGFRLQGDAAAAAGRDQLRARGGSRRLDRGDRRRRSRR